jgi:prepilin-type processing-associated H-X9-DG protein/prepilin-type N-terminal cleavage/methylation domain-containing protein
MKVWLFEFRCSNFLHRRGFTLIELLVVVGSVALLLALLLPGLSGARDQAKLAVCGSNLRQLALANAMYGQDSGGVFVPGAADFRRNRNRWHGTRDKLNQAFDSARGPLAAYLGVDGSVRGCPAFAPEKLGFEKGNGGYGYNNGYVGVQTAGDAKGNILVATDLAGAPVHQIKRAADTLMFADAAFVDGSLIEYSFAEPRFHPQFQTRADPSIHFRHAGRANIAWCDGHVTSERRTFSHSSGIYEGDPGRHDIGWFGQSDDNTYFDLQ